MLGYPYQLAAVLDCSAVVGHASTDKTHLCFTMFTDHLCACLLVHGIIPIACLACCEGTCMLHSCCASMLVQGHMKPCFFIQPDLRALQLLCIGDCAKSHIPCLLIQPARHMCYSAQNMSHHALHLLEVSALLLLLPKFKIAIPADTLTLKIHHALKQAGCPVG